MEEAIKFPSLEEVLATIGYEEIEEYPEGANWEYVDSKLSEYDLEGGWSSETFTLRHTKSNRLFNVDIVYNSWDGYHLSDNEDLQFSEAIPKKVTETVYVNKYELNDPLYREYTTGEHTTDHVEDYMGSNDPVSSDE